MESREYKYRYSRHVLYLGVAHIIIAAVLGYFIYTLYEGDYLSVWFTSFGVAYLSLLLLSIPRKVVVTSEKIEIRCVLEIKELYVGDIVSVRKINPRSLKRTLPIFAGWGFFGYYGIYFDFRSAERIHLYATEWKNFVEIVDIYDDRYIISCANRDEMIRLLGVWKWAKELKDKRGL